MSADAAISEIQGKVTKQERIAVPTERPGDFYLSLLNLTREKVFGKKIFNIGAGGSDLQNDLGKNGTKVVNCDLRYKDGAHCGIIASELVGASMTALPFADNSTDIAVNLYAAGHPPKKMDVYTLSEMVRIAKETVIVYPCNCTEETKQFISDHKLENIVILESPKFDPKLLFANLDKKEGFIVNLSRIAKNIYYSGIIEPLAKVIGAQRLTINSGSIKQNQNWAEIIDGLTKSGLSLRSSG